MRTFSIMLMLLVMTCLGASVISAQEQTMQSTTSPATTTTAATAPVTPPAPIQMCQPAMVQPMQTAQQAGQVQSEYLRCTETCTTFTSHYRFRYTQMTTHEGDQTCWQTCWQRFGGAGAPPQTEMKTFWAARRPLNMKSNLCSQACWRNFHNGSNTAQVTNWSSSPRPIERCFGEALRTTAAIPSGSTWVAPVTTSLILGPIAMAAVATTTIAELPRNMGTPGATILPGS